MATLQLNIPDIIKHIGLIQNSPSDTFEIREISPKAVYSGYFRDAAVAVEALQQQTFRNADELPTCYIVSNPIDPALFSRKQCNRFLSGTSIKTTKDDDVTQLKFLKFDIDPIRPDDCSSSADELEHAKGKGGNVHSLLKEHGFAEPVVALSGNGLHFYYLVNLEPTEENKTLISSITDNLSKLMSDTYKGGAKIDTTSKNPSRLLKLVGTPAIKGTSTDERPHRMSKFYKFPEPLEVTPIETLKAFNEFLEAVLNG